MSDGAKLIVVYDGFDVKTGDDLYKKLKREAEKAMPGLVAVMHNREDRFMEEGPLVKIYPDGQFYKLSAEQTEIFVQALQDGHKAGDLLVSSDASVYKEAGGDSLFKLLLENMTFTKERICGKCCPCRLGGPRIAQFLEHFEKNEVSLADIRLLGNTGRAMKNASMCAVGMFGADPLLFALTHFTPVFMIAVEESIVKKEKQGEGVH